MVAGVGDTTLPSGVELYLLGVDGSARAVDSERAGPLVTATDGLRFIDDGQLARYFVGDAGTSPQRPSNATYKLGVVRPHSAFTPHAHGGEHFVLSLGYASCGLYDDRRQAVVQIRLTPGSMLRIPALMPHSFGNRAGTPLLILAANTGFGIDHEDYAITAEEAERRAATGGDGPDHLMLAKALRAVEAAPDTLGGTSRRERVAAALRRLAARLEGTR